MKNERGKAMLYIASHLWWPGALLITGEALQAWFDGDESALPPLAPRYITSKEHDAIRAERDGLRRMIADARAALGTAGG